MPPQPLYGEGMVSIPSSATPNVRTHSSKFPIEREVYISNTEKSLKNPIMNDYYRKQPNVQETQQCWTQDQRLSTPKCSNIQNIPRNSPDNRIYKAVPVSMLDTTNGLEPSPILNSDDSNGFKNANYNQTGSYSHSTPENMPFPSKTIHAIKDMISNRFNNKNKPDIGPADNSLSPNSQLAQRGVYITPQQRADYVTRQNQQVRQQIIGQYRERAVDVAHTAGIYQQVTGRMPVSTPPRYRPPDYHDVQSQRSQCVDKDTPNRRQSDYVTMRNVGYNPGAPSPNIRRAITNVASNSGSPQISTRASSSSIYKKQSDYAIVSNSRTRNTEKQNSHETQSDPSDCVRQTTNMTESSTIRAVRLSKARSTDQLLDDAEINRSECAESFPPKAKSVENIHRLELEERSLVAPARSSLSDNDKPAGEGGRSDSGRGSTVYSSGKVRSNTDENTSPELTNGKRILPKKDSRWADVMDSELKQITDPKAVLGSDRSLNSQLARVSLDVSSDDDPNSPQYKRKSASLGRGMLASSAQQRNGRIGKEKLVSHHLAISKRPINHSKLPSTAASSSLDLDSMLDENNTSDDDDDFSVTDARAIRKQLEGLENMYTEVLKLLGVRKSATGGRYQPNEHRGVVHKRRMYGSMSSLPSSVSSRPIRDRHRKQDDRKKIVRDMKGVNKRFQRLESHVVTLARSVAHLSSEMRTQHLMMQEMEVIRGELTTLRAQTNLLSSRAYSATRAPHPFNSEQVNSSPDKLKKLTKFFGDEPPLLRIFLRKLGYEKYANCFEKERIGLAELPCMTEERLHKLGIPMGPRLRILQEAQLGFPAAHENTLCIV